LSSVSGTYNGSSASGSFGYDANGNMTSDGLRGLTVTYFDELNLPKQYYKNSTNKVDYTYDAGGNKWSKAATVSGTASTTLYDGTFIYENGTLKKVLTSEGYYDPSAGLYYYYLKDHLGNTRLTFHYSGTTAVVDQEVEYYPFGSLFTENNLDKNKYLYNGKELNDEFFENYDYGARFYDADLGRWHVIDLKADKFNQFSPYSYCLNNPLAYVDPDGEDVMVAFTGGPTGGGKTVAANSKDAGTTGRVLQSAENFARENGIEFSGRVITPGLTSGSSVKNAVGFVKSNYTKGEKVIVYGYSYGGDFAVELAEALGEEGIAVDLVVTVDASDGPAQNSTVNTEIPENVTENQNYYQTNDSGKSSASQKSGDGSGSDSGTSDSPGSNGGPNKAKNPNKTTVMNTNMTGNGVTHGNIDEKARPLVEQDIKKVMGSK